ncbi:hypothetical protein GOP47_0021490 [Adiantum capillus-veneris]|uniref:Uncharacterized protein n=1 Tax=Adiantum capillus-veneris TaxID=13818 RepID=A0A9D4U8H3_ADICA|nr:hypothetical protein GOP47_0021490 [Adiantum capillus-veneris]
MAGQDIFVVLSFHIVTQECLFAGQNMGVGPILPGHNGRCGLSKRVRAMHVIHTLTKFVEQVEPILSSKILASSNCLSTHQMTYYLSHSAREYLHKILTYLGCLPLQNSLWEQP